VVKNTVRVWGIRAVCILGLLWLTFSPEDTTSSLETETPILIAGQHISAFTSIKKSMATFRNYPRSLVPTGAIRSLEELQSGNGQSLYMSAVPFPKGHPLTLAALIDMRKNRGMAFSLPPGKVAVSLRVDKARGAGGWIRPGDRIALYYTDRSSDNGMSPSARTSLLFPAVTVIAVDKKRWDEAPEPAPAASDAMSALIESEDLDSSGSLLTLALYPPGALTLIQAREQGYVTAVLRASIDDLPEETHGQ
jgi:Flp pilus assembly protein CpaB